MPNNFPFNKKSFTLVEILVVVSILAVLAAATMPALIGYASERSVSRVAQLVRSDIELVRNKSLSGALTTIGANERGDWAMRINCNQNTYDLGFRNAAAFMQLERKTLPANFIFDTSLCPGSSKVLVFERLTGVLWPLAANPTPRASERFRLCYRCGQGAGVEKSSTFTIYQNGKINVQ